MNYNIKDFGAVADGKTVCTKAINDAISSCAKAGGGYVDVPAGEYVTGTVNLLSNVVIRFEPGSVFLASKYEEDFSGVERGCSWGNAKAVLQNGKYEYVEEDGVKVRKIKAQATPCIALIKADKQERCGLIGPGTVNGRRGGNYVGTENWDKAGNIFLCVFSECKNVFIRDVTFENPGFFNVYTLNCSNVSYDGIRIYSRKCACGDGLDFDGSRNVTISNCIIDAGDDAIGLKTLTPGEPCENFTITNCILSSVWAAVRIGPETGADFRNINVSNCLFDKCNDGFKLQNCENVIFEDFVFSNISMKNVMRPIFMTLNTYVMARSNPSVRPGVGTMRRIRFDNISARQIQKVEENQEGQLSGNIIYAMQGSFIEDVTLSGVNFTADGGVCEEKIVRPELLSDYIEKYPEALPHMGNYPSAILYVRNVRDLAVRDCRFRCVNSDGRPAIVADGAELLKVSDCRSVNTKGLLKTVGCGETILRDNTGEVVKASDEEENERNETLKRNEEILSEYRQIAETADKAVSGTMIYTGTYEGTPCGFEACCGKKTYLVLPMVNFDLNVVINGRNIASFTKKDTYIFSTCFAVEITKAVKNSINILEITDGNGNASDKSVAFTIFES